VTLIKPTSSTPAHTLNTVILFLIHGFGKYLIGDISCLGC